MSDNQGEKKAKSASDPDQNQNTNQGKQNTFENINEIRVDGSIELSHSVNQSVDESTKEVPIQDPSNLNGRVAFYQFLVRHLPIPSEYIGLTFGGSGLFGTLGILLYILTILPDSFQYSIQPQLPTGVLVVAVLMAVLGFGYLDARKESFCPQCENPFALETTEVVKYPELSRDEVVLGHRFRECRYCDYSEKGAREWPAEKVRNK